MALHYANDIISIIFPLYICDKFQNKKKSNGVRAKKKKEKKMGSL